MSNSNFSVIDISSIKQIKPNQWNSLVSGSNSSVFHTWEWFNAYENVYPNGALKEVHHIVVYSHKGNILAILPLLHIKRDPLWLAIATNYNVAEMEILNLDCLLSHSWYSFYSRILSIDSSLTYLSDIEKKIAQICEFNSIPYCCFSSVEINDPLYARLINQGHKPYSIIFNNRLGPLPSDFNQYIKFISSSNIRRNLIRYKNRLKNFGIKEEWIQSPSDNVINEFYLLISAACKRLNDPEPLHPYDTLKSIFNNMRNFIHLLTFRHNEILCAAVLCFVHDGVFWGCYPAMKVLPEYRPLNFYLNIHRSIIRRAIELRCTHIEFGRGECNYKSRLGSTPIKTQALVKEYSCQPGIVYKAFEKIESLAS